MLIAENWVPTDGILCKQNFRCDTERGKFRDKIPENNCRIKLENKIDIREKLTNKKYMLKWEEANISVYLFIYEMLFIYSIVFIWYHCQ
jgi:hypothetical protein